MNETSLTDCIGLNFSEKSNIAISLVDEKDEVLGHAAFLDYPSGNHVDQSKWETWLQSYHDADYCTVRHFFEIVLYWIFSRTF